MISLSRPFISAVSAAVFLASAAPAQTVPKSGAVMQEPGYADLADLALAAPLAAVVTVRSATRLKGADAVGVLPGRIRFYVEGDVETLIAGKAGLPARIGWLADVPLAPANRMPKLKKRRLIVLARPVPGRADMIQLVARDAQLDWSPALDQRLRAVLAAAYAADAPPAITGIGHAFHVAGSIPGEGETQMFLRTTNGRPVSLSVLRRPGEEPRWAVSLGEMVSDTAAAPQHDTLLWYRLACGLPSELSDESVADQLPEDAAQARRDYHFVLEKLGPCGRSE
jgi:hypothetical protein